MIYFEKCKKSEASDLMPFTILEERCGFCNSPLILIFNINEKKLATCPGCSCFQTIHVKQEGSEVYWHPSNDNSGEWYPSRMFIDSNDSENPPESPQWFKISQKLNDSGTYIGGEPTPYGRIEDIYFPECLECGQEMNFISEAEGIRYSDGQELWWVEGRYYFFTCEKCNIHACNYDQT